MEKRKGVIDIKLKLFSDDFHGCFEAGLYVNPTGNYMFKVNSRNSRTKCEICFTFTIKTPEQRHLRLCGVFIVVFVTFGKCTLGSIIGVSMLGLSLNRRLFTTRHEQKV